ncbi:MAG: leucine-rich repeat protein, partial [Muribaculaceae bacterium]
ESFKGCIALTETPNLGSAQISSVGESAFEGCSSLQSLQFTYLTSIGSKAFTGCSALTTINFQSYNKNIAPAVASEDAFDEWHYNNTAINVPDSKYSLFAEHEIWKKFLRIKHPETLAYTSVSGGYSVGKGQYALDEDFTGMLVIPEQGPSGYVVSIAAGAFRDLTGITGVTLPKKLTSIGDEAFAGCTGITTVINKATNPIECNENVFDASVYAAATLYVPFGSLDAYKNALPWSKFVNIKQGIGEHTLAAPGPSREPGIFNESGFDLTLTNPNETGSIYYYIVPEGDTSTGIRTVSIYSASSPLHISSTCTVVAYIYDGTNCSDAVSLTYTYEYVEPEETLTVWVNGKEITEENCYDVLGDKGSVTYDMKSGILTLTSATINLPDKVDQAAILSEGGALTINVDGFNYINAKTMGIFFGYAKNSTPTHRICGVGKENNTLTIMLDNSYGEGDGIYAYLSNLVIENCAVTIYNSTNGIYMKPGGLGEDGTLSVLGTSVVGINANRSALTNVLTLNIDKGLQILDPVGATFNPYGKDGNIFDAEDNLSGRLYIGSVDPSRINDIPNIPQGTETVTFTTYSEELSLANDAIGDIYFSITDNSSGCDPTYGLILNAMSSLEDVAQFNSEIESSGYASNSNFNGIAVKVKGTGSVTFPSIQNSGTARLTILLDGKIAYGDELPGFKYEFSTAKAKYLYIFGTLKDTKAAPSLKSITQGDDYVNIYSMDIEITDINGGVIDTENGLDKVLAASADDCCRINTTLYGHYHDGKYLYASTMGNSGSSKNTFNEDKKKEWWSDKESDFNQEDWVAISGLTDEFVGQEIAGGNVATVISNTAYPVISFDDKVSYTKSSGMGINTFRVANFNIHAESAAVNNIWLVAPQPAEYCTVTGYVSLKGVNLEDGYLVLQSAEGPTIQEDKTVIEPLTMNVYFDPATIKFGDEGWYAFTGIVSKEGDALNFTALEATDKPTGIEDVNAATARVFAAAGNINVAADAQTVIAVYSANGQLVTAVEATDATIAVTPGFYIVKVGNLVTKLAVK